LGHLFTGEGFEGVKDVTVAQPKPDHKHEEQGKGHSDIEIEYSLQCFKGDNLKGLKTNLFKTFKNLKTLKVTTVVKEKQSTATLTPASTTVPGF
jgi:hypothetical protein